MARINAHGNDVQDFFKLAESSLRRTNMQVFADHFDSEEEHDEDSDDDEDEFEEDVEDDAASEEKKKESNDNAKSRFTKQQEILMRRSDLIQTNWPHVEGVGSAALRKEATYLGLAVSRSSDRRICFYPRGLTKVGNTFLTFSRTKKHALMWVCTGTVNDTLCRWQQLDPLESIPVSSTTRAHKIQWSNKALKFCMDSRLHSDLSYKQIAALLNNRDHGYLDPGSREYTAIDVANKLRQVFPRELDLHHMMQMLCILKRRSGWETLSYVPEFVTTSTGATTINSIVITFPNAERLVRLYGHCIHTDATFGVLIYGHLVSQQNIHTAQAQ